MYTDDSDLICAVVHAGKADWKTLRREKRDGRDLRVVVRLTREARFVGGHGAEYIPEGVSNGNGKRSANTSDEFGDGRDLLSAGWGNGHDGAGFEILGAEFVEV